MLIKMSDRKQRRSNSHNIIVRNYEHYNSAFKNWDCNKGKYISSKSAYYKALHDEGMITEKEAERSGFNASPKRKEYKVTKDTLDLIESVKQTADKKGNIKPGDRAISKLMEKRPTYNAQALPAHYHPEGGFK